MRFGMLLNSYLRTGLLAILFLAGSGYTRGQGTDVPAAVRHALDSIAERYHLTRTAPAGFRWLTDHEFIPTGSSWTVDPETAQGVKKEGARAGVLGTLFQSADRNCALVYEDIYDFQFYAPDLAAFRRHQPQYRTHMSHLLASRLNRTDFRLEDYVTSLSPKIARRTFRADSVLFLELPIEPITRDSATYTHCIYQVLVRKEHAYMGFAWFLTPEGYGRRTEYMQALEGAIRYRPGRWRNQPEWIERQNRELRRSQN